MKNWQKKYPPYEGGEGYLYFAFADGDVGKVWPVMRTLLQRGVRVWYCTGPAGSAEELLHRQERARGAALTLLYLTDAAVADKDTKSRILVNEGHVLLLLPRPAPGLGLLHDLDVSGQALHELRHSLVAGLEGVADVSGDVLDRVVEARLDNEGRH